MCAAVCKMKVEKIETIHVRPRWLFLKVYTDSGIVGLGEATLEGRSQTVETAVKEIERYLVGEDPLQIEKHWQTIYRGTFYRNGPVLSSALSGVEQALWDILGKHLQVPVHQLLGGKCEPATVLVTVSTAVWMGIWGGDRILY
jgi:galactonate dehydratase